jgi:hypothetical protein
VVTIWVKEVGIECKWSQCGVISRVLNVCGCYVGLGFRVYVSR